jgi:DNA-binding transcriptional MerR regulator
MNPSPDSQPEDLPLIEADLEATYTLEVVARISGVSPETILLYREQGFIASVRSENPDTYYFDNEALRAIRRLEHLRTELKLNETALKLMLNLLTELERLRDETRSRR